MCLCSSVWCQLRAMLCYAFPARNVDGQGLVNKGAKIKQSLENYSAKVKCGDGWMELKSQRSKRERWRTQETGKMKEEVKQRK